MSVSRLMPSTIHSLGFILVNSNPLPPFKAYSDSFKHPMVFHCQIDLVTKNEYNHHIIKSCVIFLKELLVSGMDNMGDLQEHETNTKASSLRREPSIT